MSDQPSNNLAREERLAAQLRENLRRRKAQARAMGAIATDSPSQVLSKPATGS